MLPSISVVTATHQLAEYLPQCIESVLNQRYPEDLLDLIVVDDASTDDTPEVVSRYRDPRVRYVRLPVNKGAGGARNVGVGLARGEFIAFLDGDDYWFPNRLSSMVPLIDNETDLITSDFFYEDGGVIGTQSAYHGRQLEWLFDLDVHGQFRALLEDGFLALSMMLVPRAVLQRVGVFNESLRTAQDYELWLRALNAGSRVICAREPLGVYRRMRDGSITATLPERRIEERIEILRPYLRMCSPARARNVRGDAAYLALRRAMRSRRPLSMLRPVGELLLNPRYVSRRLITRLTPKWRRVETPPLIALRDSLTSSV